MIVLIGLIYIILILAFINSFDRMKPFEGEITTFDEGFSVIIPFRNEEENLPQLLKTIQLLDYPNHLLEFLFIDDHSTDTSVKILEDFKEQHTTANISIIPSLAQYFSPKKNAILTGIENAKHSWIITTDADCILPKTWLKTIASFIEKEQPKAIVAPVSYMNNASFFKSFQMADFLSLQMTTIATFGINDPILCNGANFIYQKEAFEQVNGFEGNNNIASGDDIYLLQKFKRAFPKKLKFLKSSKALVLTQPVQTLDNLIHQRTRWAAKTGNIHDPFTWFIGGIVLLSNFVFILLFVLYYLKLIPLFSLFFVVIKVILDISYILIISNFYKQKMNVFYILVSSFIYPFFTVFIAFRSVFYRYEWKGRSFKK